MWLIGKAWEQIIYCKSLSTTATYQLKQITNALASFQSRLVHLDGVFRDCALRIPSLDSF